MVPYVKAYSDIFIKFLFGSPNSGEVLLDFLNAVQESQGYTPLTWAQTLSPYSLEEAARDKHPVLDIRAVDQAGRQYNIEVQTRQHPQFPERSLYYWAKLYAKQLGRGRKYDQLKPVVGINLLGETLFDTLPAVNSFTLSHKSDPSCLLTDHIVFHYLELPKLKYPRTELTELDKWMVFFKYEGTKEFDMSQLKPYKPSLETAHTMYREFTRSEKARDAALRRQLWEMDQLAYQDAARNKGLTEGREEGLIEGRTEGDRAARLDTARAMKTEGLPPEQIARITGLSPEEVSQL